MERKARLVMEGVKTVLAALAAIFVVAVVGWLGYEAYWAIKGENVDRNVEITNTNTGVQTAWRDEAHDKIEDYEVLGTDSPAAMQLKTDACDLIGRLTDNYLDDQLVQFQETEC